MRGRKNKPQLEIYQINEKWRIDQDSLNFMLQRRGESENGEAGVAWVTVGFYQTVKQLFHALVEKNIKGISLANIKDVNEKISELHKLIDNAAGIMTLTKEGEVNG